VFLTHAPVAVSAPQITPLAGGAISQTPWRYDGALAGMIGKGLGLQAISAYLGAAPAIIMGRVVELGLATPHDEPFRRMKHAKAWPVSDFRRLIDCWLDNWKASSASKIFGRSLSSIYGQVRRLGLPRRSRRDLHQPTPEAFDQLQRARGALGALCRDLFDTVDKSLVKVITRASGEILRIERKLNRDEVRWTTALDLEISDRAWSCQHHKAIARDLGISPRAICTRLSALGVPPRDRKELVDFYDPAIGQERIRKSRYKMRQCSFLKNQIFWSAHFGETTSKVAKRSKAYHEAFRAIL